MSTNDLIFLLRFAIIPCVTQAWKHQIEGTRRIVERQAVYLAWEMRTGKSRAVIDAIKELSPKRTLIICPKPVVPVWPAEFIKHGAEHIRVLALDSSLTVANRVKLARKVWIECGDKPLVIVTNLDAVWREPMGDAFLKPMWDMVAVDECFAAGTRINTPRGMVPIEDIAVGDSVIGFDSEKTVLSTVRCTFKSYANAGLRGPFRCTGNHPVWTGRGWIRADEVLALDTVLYIGLKPAHGNKAMRVVWGELSSKKRREAEILRPFVLCKVEDVEAGFCENTDHAKTSGSFTPQHDKTSQTSGCQKKAESASCWFNKPFSGKSWEGNTKTVCADNGREGMAHVEWREWDRSHGSPENLVGGFGRRLGDGTRNQNQNADEQRISDLLQSGHCQRDVDGCNRSKWHKPQRSEDQRERFEESFAVVIDGLEGDQRSEPRCHVEPVYNLETDTGNYFAEGVLVHNCHRAKDGASRIGKYLNRLSRHAVKRVALSGTPMPHSPLDVWAQVRFLDPKIYPPTWTQMKARYAIMGGYRHNGRPVQVVGFQNIHQLQRKFETVAHVVKRIDVMDVPPSVSQFVAAEMPRDAWRVYKELEEDLIAQVDSGVVTAANALAKTIRLQQVTSGVVPMEEGGGARLHDGKRDVLVDFLNDLPHDEPVVVFARFHGDLDGIHEACVIAKRPSVELSGRRNDVGNEWRNVAPGCVCAAQVQAASVGINLSVSSHVVYWSGTWSLGDYDQSQSRVIVSGKMKPVTYTHIVVPKTIDQTIYEALDKRRNVVESIIQSMRRNQNDRSDKRETQQVH